MASVSQSAPPVRHGRCRLSIVINGVTYKLRRKPAGPHGRVWVLTHADGPRAGVSHVVARQSGFVACTCEDSIHRGSRCKHMRALVAAGLLSGRSRPAPSQAAAAAAISSLRDKGVI